MLGPLQERVLLVLANSQAEVTATSIYSALTSTLRRVSLGAIYVTLDRLEENNFVARRRGKPRQERGGKAQYYYRLTDLGRTAVNEAEQERAALGPTPCTRPGRAKLKLHGAPGPKG
jgi:DNA-binding PadR family transcriptional regulator